MKSITRISFLSLLSISLVASLHAQLLFNEDFAGAAGTALTSANWLLSGTTTTNPLTIGSPGLTFTGHPASGVGNALPMANTGQDLYRSFSATSSGSVYLSFLVNVSAVLTGDYFIALSPSASQTNYYARLHVKSSGTGYVFGINKSNEVTGGAQFGSTVCNLNTTYFVVVKYTFAGTATDSTNDPINVYVFASGANIATEPATAEISAYVASSKNDAVDLSFVTLRQGSNTAAPTLIIDAIRVSKTWASILTGVESQGISMPSEFSLSQNYPNPFNPTTNVEFRVSTTEHVVLKVFDALGREVAALVNEEKAPGTYRTSWDASRFESGVYFYRLQTRGYVETRKMILVK
jgi:trimeric autotransporter adhesin